MSIETDYSRSAASKAIDALRQEREEAREQTDTTSPFERFSTTFFSEMGAVTRLFETLQKLPPNTNVHFSERQREFIVTAPQTYLLPGAQAVADFVKGHDPEDIGDRLGTIASTIRTQLDSLRLHLHGRTAEERAPFFRALYLSRVAFNMAVTGRIEDGGVTGLIKTYRNHANMAAELTTSVEKIRLLISLEVLARELGPKVNISGYCVEEDFSAAEWDQLCKETTCRSPTQGSLKAYSQSSLSLFLTQFESLRNSEYKWWNKITLRNKERADEGDLYLGALPVAAPKQNTLDELKEQRVQAVLSLVEPFENQSIGFVTSAITPAQLEEAKIKQLQIPSFTDSDIGTLQDMQRGVAFIRWNIHNSRSIYVHDQTGTERSGLMVAAYLIKHHRLRPQEALDLIKRNRPQAGFEETNPKMTLLIQYENLILQQRLAERN